MYDKNEGMLRCLIADPDPHRRERIAASGRSGTTIEAASLSEAFDMAEAHRPDAIALSTDIGVDAGFDMFLHLIDALGISLVVYGDRARDGTPQRLRKAISFVPFGPTDPADRVFKAFLKERSAKRAHQGGDHGAKVLAGSKRPSLIALGASTGGVSALETVLTAFPVDCPPTLVVQHIRAGFIDSMIKRLDGVCHPRILPAENGLRPQPGHVYVAHDPDRHLELQPGEAARCRLAATPPRHGHRPSVDALFETVAGRRNVAAALLTGMGADGAEGLKQIRLGGGLTIAQNEATCVVYGMPKVAVELGAAEHVLPLDRIALALIDGTVTKKPMQHASRELAK
jgi:two-component system chemotaxis response regulator CheB